MNLLHGELLLDWRLCKDRVRIRAESDALALREHVDVHLVRSEGPLLWLLLELGRADTAETLDKVCKEGLRCRHSLEEVKPTARLVKQQREVIDTKASKTRLLFQHFPPQEKQEHHQIEFNDVSPLSTESV